MVQHSKNDKIKQQSQYTWRVDGLFVEHDELWSFEF